MEIVAGRGGTQGLKLLVFSYQQSGSSFQESVVREFLSGRGMIWVMMQDARFRTQDASDS